MKTTIEVPSSYVGDVIGDLQKRGGQLQSMEEASGQSVVSALVPLAGLTGYATALRSLSQGRGTSSMVLEGYHPETIKRQRALTP